MRRIATNTRRMRWMLSYIDFIVKKNLETGRARPVAPQTGDRVLALWKSDDYWYCGTVADVSEGRLFIKFQDGYAKWLTLEQVKSLEYSVDDYVECAWKGSLIYYPAHIIEIKGDEITVQYGFDFSQHGPSMGEKEQTNVKFLRFSK